MNAAVVERAGQIVVRALPDVPLEPYQARCRMLFGSICAGTDTHFLLGHKPFCDWFAHPFILGHESVGQVVEVGPKVRHLRVGDVVTRVGALAVGDVSSAWGGFSDTGIATDWQAMRDDGLTGWQSLTSQQILPADVPPAHGTLFITWRETLSYVTRMGIGQGSSVLVIGSGGNGLAFVAHARNRGATRVVLVGSESRSAVARRAGATDVVDYKNADYWTNLNTLLPDGFDFVIDSVGKHGVASSSLSVLKPGGLVGVYGMDDAGPNLLDPALARGTFTVYRGHYKEAEAHEDVLAFYRAGKLDPAVWFEDQPTFPLSDIANAFDAIRTRGLIKPLIRLTGD